MSENNKDELNKETLPETIDEAKQETPPETIDEVKQETPPEIHIPKIDKDFTFTGDIDENVKQDRVKKKKEKLEIQRQQLQTINDQEPEPIKKKRGRRKQKVEDQQEINQEATKFGFLLQSAFSSLVLVLFGEKLTEDEKKHTEDLAIEYSKRTGSTIGLLFLALLIFLGVLLPKMYTSIKDKKGLFGKFIDNLKKQQQTKNNNLPTNEAI